MIRSADEKRPFELRVVQREGSSYGMALYQPELGRSSRTERIVQIWGDPLRAVMDHVLAALRQGGYRTFDLGRRSVPYRLREEDGVRLGLIFLAIKPLRKLSRITAISENVGEMSTEEIYYWFSKTTHRKRKGCARRALRILMAEE